MGGEVVGVYGDLVPYFPVTPTSGYHVSDLAKRGGREDGDGGSLFVRFVMVAVCVGGLGRFDVLMSMCFCCARIVVEWSGFA